MLTENSDTLSRSDTDIFGLTLLGEARGLGQVGMTEVACTVLRRVKVNKWWGHTPRAVCLYPWQYSSWNTNNPAACAYRAKLLAWPTYDPDYKTAWLIAKNALDGNLVDITNGATHYFNHVTLPVAEWPTWYDGQVPCHVDEPHWFFDLSKSG